MYFWNRRKVATETDGFLASADTGERHGPGLRFREAANRRVHRLLDSGPPLPRPVLRQRSSGPSGRVGHPRLRVHRLSPIHSTAEEEAERAPRGPRGRPADAASAGHPAASTDATAAAVAADEADARPLAILFPVRRAQCALLPLPAVLLLLLEPRKQSRRRTERPELEDDLAMFLVLRDKEHPLALRNHIDRLLERNLVVAFPFLAAGKIEPFHVEEEDPSPSLPPPSFAFLNERPLCDGHWLEEDVLEGAVPDDLVAAMEDGLVRFGEDDPHLPDLINLHPGRAPSRAG